MNYSILNGKCKKEFKLLMKPIKGCPDCIPDQYCGYEIGDSIFAYLTEDSDDFGDRNKQMYEITVNYKKVQMTREEVEDLIDIHFERDCYNGCVKDGVPCARLRGFTEGKTARDRKDFNSWCNIHWETGRGSCAGYVLEDDLY